MKILVIVKDEIITQLFSKKYQPLLNNITIEYGERNSEYSQKIQNNEYQVVICDLDEGIEEALSFYHLFPEKTPFLFITDAEYTVYLKKLKDEGLPNIYPKGLLIEDYITSAKLISNLCKKSIFGIHNYIENPIFLETTPIHYSSEMRKMNHKINFLFPFLNKERIMILKLAFAEIVSNAFFHSHSLQKGKEAYIKDPIFISFAEDKEKIIFSVTDKKGTLSRDVVFYWLLKRFESDQNLPLEHGRGFFLMKNIIDNLIINIKPGEMTEFIAIFYKTQYMGVKSLIIHQL